MARIGTFSLSKDGGWSGNIRTLTINRQIRLVPNERQDNPKAPAFRVMVGHSKIGDAWDAQSSGQKPRYYLRVRLDDPSLPEPLTVALFPNDDSDRADLVWNRRSN